MSTSGFNHLGNPRVIFVFCTVRFISQEALGKTWTGTPKNADFSWLCILQDSKLSFPVFPGPLSEVGLVTLFSFISFLLSAGMKHEKKALYDSAGHWISTGWEPAAAPAHLSEQQQQPGVVSPAASASGGSSIPGHSTLVSQLHPSGSCRSWCQPSLSSAAGTSCWELQHHTSGAPGPELAPMESPGGAAWCATAPAELICSAGSLHSCWPCPSVIPADPSSWSQKLDIGSS